jgi:hypothetical protein
LERNELNIIRRYIKLKGGLSITRQSKNYIKVKKNLRKIVFEFI